MEIGFDARKRLLDGVEVGRIRRQVNQFED
jgi:hypothetical protein